MRILIIALLVIILLVMVSRLFAGSSSSIEQYPYEVLEEHDGFEIRKYKASNFASVELASDSYSENSGNGFRQLAGYIFGGNERNQKIAMTSPVAVEMDDKMEMRFMIPAEHQLTDLPKPDNSNVRFITEPEKVVAAVQFGGWANDKRIESQIEKLKSLLQKKGIKPNGNYSYLGYNPPYEVINRKNEIIVEVEWID